MSATPPGPEARPTVRELRALLDRDVTVTVADLGGSIRHVVGRLLSVRSSLWVVVDDTDTFIDTATVVAVTAA